MEERFHSVSTIFKDFELNFDEAFGGEKQNMGQNSVVGTPSELGQGHLHPADREDSRDSDHDPGERPQSGQRAQVRTVLHCRHLHRKRSKVFVQEMKKFKGLKTLRGIQGFG